MSNSRLVEIWGYRLLPYWHIYLNINVKRCKIGWICTSVPLNFISSNFNLTSHSQFHLITQSLLYLPSSIGKPILNCLACMPRRLQLSFIRNHDRSSGETTNLPSASSSTSTSPVSTNSSQSVLPPVFSVDQVNHFDLSRNSCGSKEAACWKKGHLRNRLYLKSDWGNWERESPQFRNKTKMSENCASSLLWFCGDSMICAYFPHTF
jgi:hypothetical protein